MAGFSGRFLSGLSPSATRQFSMEGTGPKSGSPCSKTSSERLRAKFSKVRSACRRPASGEHRERRSLKTGPERDSSSSVSPQTDRTRGTMKSEHIRSFSRADKNQETPLVICLQLPNARQGYWQVVKDIHNVEKVKINTVSIGALLLLLWNNVELDMAESPFYADYDRMEIRTKLEYILDEEFDLPIRDLGILEPVK